MSACTRRSETEVIGRQIMIFVKIPFVLSTLLALTACGGAGHVGQSAANRGAAVENEGTYQEVITRAAATGFVTIDGQPMKASTTGNAEVIYANRVAGQRVQIANLEADAEARSKAVSGCIAANADHVQNSIQGTHVIVALAGCPPISAQGGMMSRIKK